MYIQSNLLSRSRRDLKKVRLNQTSNKHKVHFSLLSRLCKVSIAYSIYNIHISIWKKYNMYYIFVHIGPYVYILYMYMYERIFKCYIHILYLYMYFMFRQAYMHTCVAVSFVILSFMLLLIQYSWYRYA